MIRYFFDMDGVLCDFEGACLTLFGIPFPKGHLPENEFASFRDNLYKHIEEMGSSFWANLDPFPEMVSMFNLLSLNGRDVQVLTAIPKHYDFGSPEALMVVDGKRAWIHKYLGELGDKLHIVKADMKQFYVPKYATGVLIDDHITNIDQWNDRGGVGILHTDFETTTKQLFDQTKVFQNNDSN